MAQPLRCAPPARRWPRRLGLVLLLLVIAAAAAYVALDRPLPVGDTGPGAEALARRLQQAVNHEAWTRTGAVRWTFAGRHRHLWDRERHWARVRWDDVEVQLDLTSRRGLAWRDGQPVAAADLEDLLVSAWERWVNDAFWLNPVAKVFDAGVERRLVTRDDGGSALLVTYGSGGATPGDSYLWLADDDGLPVAWRMWVSILPVGGLRATWEGWVPLASGARVSTRHRVAGLDLLGWELRLDDVAGAHRLTDLEPGPDPFAALAAALALPESRQ